MSPEQHGWWRFTGIICRLAKRYHATNSRRNHLVRCNTLRAFIRLATAGKVTRMTDKKSSSKSARKSAKELRSYRWLGEDDLRSSSHRSRFMQIGFAEEDWKERPVIAIVNTWSDINQCHTHFKHRVEDVKRGVFQAGGLPLELPAISLSEPLLNHRPCCTEIFWQWKQRNCCAAILSMARY